MSSAAQFPPPGFETLSREEMLEYVEKLLQLIPSEPVPAGIWNEMQRRLDEYDRGDVVAEDWQVALARIEKDFGFE